MVTADVIQAAIAQLVEVGRPTKIILFGSHARGDARPNSDLDFLVKVHDLAHLLDLLADNGVAVRAPLTESRSLVKKLMLRGPVKKVQMQGTEELGALHSTPQGRATMRVGRWTFFTLASNLLTPFAVEYRYGRQELRGGAFDRQWALDLVENMSRWTEGIIRSIENT